MNVFCAFDDTVICNKESYLGMVAPCSQEEGDTRVLLHVQDMVRSEHGIVKVRTVDTVVIVIGLAMFQMISGLQELWIELVTENTKRYYLIHKLQAKLGAYKATAMTFFHALTRGDQVTFSCFCKKKQKLGTP